MVIVLLLIDVDFVEKKKHFYATNTELKSEILMLQIQNSMLQARVNELEVETVRINSALKRYKEEEDLRERRVQESIGNNIPNRNNPNRNYDPELCSNHFRVGKVCKNDRHCYNVHYLSDYSGTQTHESYTAFLQKTYRSKLDDTKWNMIRPEIEII